MLSVPRVAVRLAVIFIVEVPLPAIDDGLNETDVPPFCPDAESAIDETVPSVTVVEIVELPEEPRKMLRVAGFAPIVKSEGAAVTVRFTVVTCTVPSPPLPVTVTDLVPVAADALATKLIVVFPEGPNGFVP